MSLIPLVYTVDYPRDIDSNEQMIVLLPLAVAKRVLYISSRYSSLTDLVAREAMRLFSTLASYCKAKLLRHLNVNRNILY